MKKYFSSVFLLAMTLCSYAQMWPPISDGCADPSLGISGLTTSLCPGSTYTYTPNIAEPVGFVVESFQWSPLTGIVPFTLGSGLTTPPPLPIICPDVATTYTLTTWSVGPNLINNGDFHTICPGYPSSPCQKYPGFTTEYQDYAGSSGNTQGHMKLGSWSGSAATCLPPMPSGYDPNLDVFTRNGTGADYYSDNRMLNVRGATCIGHRQWMLGVGGYGWWDNDHCAEAAPAYFWGQNVHLCHGETYRFTYYVRLMSPCTTPGEQPRITVAVAAGENTDYTHDQTTFVFGGTEIDGAVTGREVGITGCGKWQQVQFTFVYGGPTGNFFICMIDKNTNNSGNDFSIDDISLNRINKNTASITLNPIPHMADLTVTPNDASGGYDGYPCAGSNPFTIHCTPGATVVYSIDGGPAASVPVPGGTYVVPFTGAGGTVHSLTITQLKIGGCTISESITKTVKFIDKPKDILISGPRQVCQGDVFTLTATATYAGVGLYGTTYSWSPAPVSVSGASATFHATDAGYMIITCTITNNCGATTSEEFKVWVISAGATASVVGCNPTCPGGTTDVVITGTPDAIVHYTTDLPGFTSPGSLTMPSGAGSSTFSLPTMTLPDGSYHFTITEVDANGCKNMDVKNLDIYVRKPQCNLSLHIPTGKPPTWTPCYGDDYNIDVSGDPGTYTIQCGLVEYTFSVTAGDTTVSPPFHMPGATHQGFPYGIATVQITKIVGCGGCTVELTEGTSLCVLHVYAALVPTFDFLTKPYCTGVPSTISLVPTVPLTVTGSTWYPDDPYPAEWAGEAFTSPTPSMAQSITAVTTGFHTYKVTLTGDNGCSYTNSVTLDMKPGPAPISGPSTVCAGSILTLTESPVPGTGWWGPSFVTWPWELLKVDQSGLVHAYNPGTATVYYELPGGCRSTKTITITPGVPIRGWNYICGVPGTTTLTIAASGGTWSSSDPSIATVDASGLVTSTGYGTAIISYTPAGGSGCVSVIDLNVMNSSLATVALFHGAPPRPLFMCPHVTDPEFYRITAPMDARVTFSITTATPGCATIPLSHFAAYNSATDLYTATIPWMGTFDFEASWDNDDVPACSITSLNLVQMDYQINGAWCSVPLSGSASPKPGGHTNSPNTLHVSTPEFAIVPNPNNGTFHLTGTLAETSNDKNLTVEIVDILGHVLYVNHFTANSNVVDQVINLQSSVANGNYLLKVRNSEVNDVYRFTVQR